MKRNIKRLPALLLAVILCLSLLPATALAASFPSKFYASITLPTSSTSSTVESFGTVSSNGTYTKTGTTKNRVISGMESAGGVFFTVEGNRGKGSSQGGDYIMTDDGWRELRMYNSSLTSYRTIGTVNEEGGAYWIVDTAMDLSGEEPALYGTYQSAGIVEGAYAIGCPYICKIDLTSGQTSNWLQVTGLESEKNDIIYAIAFDKDGTLYAIGADKADDGGEATLYTIDLDNVQTGALPGSQTVPAHKIAAITSQTGDPISTNFAQDLDFDYASGTLYWAENKGNVVYTVDTKTAVATRVGQVKYNNKAYALQSFCFPKDTALGQDKDQYMISVICEGAGTVTSGGEDKTFYMVDNGGDITLNITPDVGSGLRSVKVDGRSVTLNDSMEYTFTDVTKSHVIEVTFKKEIPAEQKTVTWLHYQGEPASFYTVDNVYKFYDLPYLDKEAPREDYTQTLLDENGDPIPDNEIILPGNYNVRVTHPGNEKYAAMDVIYTAALQLAKCPGTPGRPVVYGKVGCTQGDLTTSSALQDYYGTDGTLIDSAHDEIPVTLVWLNPETTYNEAGNFSASATIYAAEELDQRLKDCYNLDDEGTPLKEGDQISSRNTQVIVLPADQASIIRLQASDDSGGTVSGKGVYKNGDEVTVTATVNGNAGYEFKGWQENGSVVSSDLTYTFTAEKDRTLTALFELSKKYTVRLTVDPTGAGTVTGGGSYDTGEHKATVTATANQGYYFIGWFDGDMLKSEQAEYKFPVTVDGASLTAKFGIDYLARAEQAQTNFASAVSTDAFEWQTLVQAVDAYKAAADFVQSPPSGIQDAETRYAALTAYYQSVTALDLSNQGIDNADLAKLYLFTGVTELNLSSNRGVTDLTGLTSLTTLTTLDISNTGVTNLGSNQSVPQNLATLTAKNLSLTSISALAELVSAEGFNTDAITKWDFTGSTLPDTEESKSDVETIKTKLGDKFLPPTIKTTPTGGGGGGGGVATYAISIPEETTGGALAISPEKAAKGSTVTLTVTPDEGYELDTLTVTDVKGNAVATTSAGDGKYTFTMPDSKVEIAVSFKESAGQQIAPFIDVSGSAYYYDAVLWAVEHGVTNGTSATTFSPDMTVTRAQMVTFLWRAHGSPRASGANPFADVSADAYYYDAVLWAVENGVTVGTSATAFSPDAPVTRTQAVTFQWRTAGSPKASGDSFDDVAADAYYADAVTWAVANGITNGTSASTFSPEVAVSRAQAVTFLYRELA